MNILPNNYKEFKDKKYWDHFFGSLKNTQNQFFQWYGAYSDYKHLLHSLIHPEAKIFHVGCGKSTFSEDLIKDSPKLTIVNCDYSQTVIKEMKDRAEKLTIKMEYAVCDLFQPLEARFVEKFDVVLDKGTLDAMLPEDSVANVAKIKEGYFTNLNKSLSIGKRSKIIIISLLQPFVLKAILEYYGFQPQKYQIDIYECLIKDSKMQPFLVQITLLPEAKEKFVLFHSLAKETLRWTCIEEALEGIEKIQKQVNHGGRIKELTPGRRTKFNLYSPQNRKDLRYLVEVIDSQNKETLQKNSCSIFIVPQGKETSYLFNDDTGLKALHSQINSSRLIVVKLVAGSEFSNLEQVKKELNVVMADFVQNGCDPNKAPYLTDADQLGNRKYLFQNEEFILDEVIVQGEPIRRLFLRMNPTVPQCEFKLTYLSQANHKELKYVGSKILPLKKNMVTGIDRQELFDDSARFIYSGLKAFLGHPKVGWKILILGCQFALAKYLTQLHDNCEVTMACGNLKSVKQVVHKYIQIEESQRLQLNELTPQEFFAKNPEDRFNVIINCTNEKNNAENPSFESVSNAFHQKVISFLQPPGLYVCQYRDYEAMPNFLQSFFPVYGSQCSSMEENIVFCLTHPRKETEGKIVVHKSLVNFKPKGKPEFEWQSDNFKDIIMLQPSPKVQGVAIDQQSPFEDIYASLQSEKSQKKASKKKKKKR